MIHLCQRLQNLSHLPPISSVDSSLQRIDMALHLTRRDGAFTRHLDPRMSGLDGIVPDEQFLIKLFPGPKPT
jgi:hypothetical protein